MLARVGKRWLTHSHASDVVRPLALALSGAAAMIVAAPPRDAWAIGMMVWTPLAVLAASYGPLRCGLFAWLQGTVAQAIALGPGAVEALHKNIGASGTWSFALAALLTIFEGGRVAAVGALTSRAVGNGWPLVLALPALLVSVEYVYPMVFPWTTFMFFHNAIPLLQGAELGGPLLLSLWAGIVDASLATAWLRRARPAALWRFAVALPVGILGIVSLAGIMRLRSIDARVAVAPAMTVGIVQGNVTETKSDPRDRVALYREASLDLLASTHVDLLVWPETAIAEPVPEDRLPQLLATRVRNDAMRPLSPRINVPVLSGLVLVRNPSDGPAHIRHPGDPVIFRRFNSAVLATADGRVGGVYDKRSLVVFGETTPLARVLPWLRQLTPSGESFTPGSSSAPLVLNGSRLLVLVCYEDILGELVRSAVHDGDPDLLFNLTSDAAFGQSRVLALHMALSKLRAIEHRKYLVRATNTGLSVVIDPAGRIVASLPANRAAFGAARVHCMREPTVYGSAGDLSWLSVVGFGSAMMLMIRRRAEFSYRAGA